MKLTPAGANVGSSLAFKGKGEILSDSAIKQGEKGFSDIEITDLPAEEIRAILVGDNLLAQEAVKYFFLYNKLK